MKVYLKMPGYWLLAEVLTLFIDLTFSFSDHAVVRILCAVCTVGIYLSLMVQGGYAAARADKKRHIEFNPLRPLTLGLAGAAVPALLTIALLLAKLGVLADGFYRLYKLLCAPFLAVCNLMSADIAASSLPAWGIAVLLALSLAAIPAVMIAYKMTFEGKAPEDAMYR